MNDAQKAVELKPEFDKEAAARVIELDLMSAERFGAQRLLEKVHELFPMAKAGMPADFKGTHDLTLNAKGQFVIHVWWGGYSWPLTFSGSLEAPPRTTLPDNFSPVEAILQK